MTEQFKRDLAHYTAHLAQAQRESDLTNDWLGFPRVDLAYAKAMERAQRRAMPTTVALRQYSKAIGL